MQTQEQLSIISDPGSIEIYEVAVYPTILFETSAHWPTWIMLGPQLSDIRIRYAQLEIDCNQQVGLFWIWMRTAYVIPAGLFHEISWHGRTGSYDMILLEDAPDLICFVLSSTSLLSSFSAGFWGPKCRRPIPGRDRAQHK